MRKLELLIIIGLTTLQIFLAAFDITGPLRVVSGFVFLTILPGYVLLSVFFRDKLDNDGLLMHLVLSIPISLAIISTLGLLANYFSIGLEIISNVTWLSTFILIFAFISYFRRSNEKIHSLKLNRIILIIGSLVILFAVNFSISDADENSESTYLRLYALNNESQTGNYPNRVQAGIPFEIQVDVEYGGKSEHQFTLTSSLGSKVRLSLSPGETWTKNTEMTLNEPGIQEVTWTLYQNGRNIPQREIRLWLTAY